MHRPLLTLFLVSLAAPLAAAAGPGVEFKRGDHNVDVRLGGKLFTSYVYSDDLPKPVLYPVQTPSGVVVSRGYPPRAAEGESQDHPHHGGIFFAYDQVNGNNFWLNTSRSPHIEHVRFTRMQGGDGEGRLGVVLHWVAKDGAVLLEETREMTFRVSERRGHVKEGDVKSHDDVKSADHAGGYVVDFAIDLAAQKEKVVFGDTKEGMLAIRVADWMREPFEKKAGVVGISGAGSGKYLSSNGDEGEKDVWGKRAKWVCLQASVGRIGNPSYKDGQAPKDRKDAKDGQQVGIAIFHHPSSVNYPTYWHARGYGLFAANPLGQGVFEAERHPGTMKPLRLTLEPGEKTHMGFRVLVFDGRRTKQELDAQFTEFAK